MRANNAVLIIMLVMISMFLIAATLIKIAVIGFVVTLTSVRPVWMARAYHAAATRIRYVVQMQIRLIAATLITSVAMALAANQTSSVAMATAAQTINAA